MAQDELRHMLDNIYNEKYPLFLKGLKEGRSSLSPLSNISDISKKQMFISSHLNSLTHYLQFHPLEKPKEFGEALGTFYAFLKDKDFELVFENNYLQHLFISCLNILKRIPYFDYKGVQERLEHVDYHRFKEDSKRRFLQVLHIA